LAFSSPTQSRTLSWTSVKLQSPSCPTAPRCPGLLTTGFTQTGAACVHARSAPRSLHPLATQPDLSMAQREDSRTCDREPRLCPPMQTEFLPRWSLQTPLRRASVPFFPPLGPPAAAAASWSASPDQLHQLCSGVQGETGFGSRAPNVRRTCVCWSRSRGGPHR